MSDRSDEVTASRESGTDPPRSTGRLLEETQRLLERAGGGGRTSGGDADLEPGRERQFESESESESDADGRSLLPSPSLPSIRSGASKSRSVVGSVSSRFSLSYYFSPKAFLGFVLAIAVGLLVGGTTIPMAGRLVGTFAVTFLLGLVTARRRYVEVTAAGVSVGAVSALANHAILAFAGSGQTVAAVGATAGVLASLLGYYLGRDLRSGLFDDVS